jgi:hypothetical protein
LWSPPKRVIHAPFYGGYTPLVAVSCPSVSLCVAIDDLGYALTSTHPTAGARAWRLVSISPAGDLRAVACPSVSLCVAVDGQGDVLTSTHPTGGAGAWAMSRVDPGHALVAVSCPSRSLCVALDRDGRALSSTRPTSGARGWVVANVNPGVTFNALSCPSVSLCVASDNADDVITSEHPSGGQARVDGSSCPGRVHRTVLSNETVLRRCRRVGRRHVDQTDHQRPVGGERAAAARGCGL